MNFTVIPDNFAPTDGGLVYGFDCGKTLHSAEVKIIDAASDEIRAVCRFTDTAHISIDIAPYVRKMMSPSPTDGHTGVSIDCGRSAVVRLDIEGVRSDIRRYSMCGLGAGAGIFSTMPERRPIAYGEADEVTFYAPEGGTVTVTAQYPDGRETREYEIAASDEVQVFRLDTGDFRRGAASYAAAFALGDATTALHYETVSRRAKSRRLSWLSSLGSIESYTFPVCRSRRLTVKKSRILSADGYRTFGIDCERTISLVSDYEPSAVIRALEELLCSPSVRMTDGTRSIPVDVITTECEISCDGGLNSIKAEVRPQTKEVRL
ncbi:MAG: hypothetical protein J6K28_05275 [Alistipes sp.]|nr:hypothetical protein [Alistipes sp.]